MLLKAREPLRFRNKFVKLIEKSPKLISKLNQVIFLLCLRPEKYVENLLWSLTINPEDALLKMGLSIGTNYQSENEISEEMIIPLRNEIRYQYKLKHSSFLEVKGPKELQEPFKVLKAEVQSDDLIAKKIWDAAITIVAEKQEFEIDRITYLLSSKKEANVYGGLRTMNFSSQEANFLKDYAQQIVKVVKALSQLEKAPIKVISTKCVRVDFEKVGQQYEKENQADQKEEENEPQKQSTVIAKDTIKANLRLFETFLDSCKNLRQLGIPPEEILKNEQDVRQTLNSLQELKQA